MSVYGIDLGTTNSLIGLHSTGYLSDLIPSCVDIETGKAGKDQYDNMKAKRSFKIDMSMGVEGIMPRQASKYVLKELCNQVKDDVVKDVVISVPAYFSDSQRAATISAAEDAGLNVLNLVNEPTAAAMYIAKNKKGLFVVYDLGGGTFDCTIIDSRFGTFDVQATDGCTIGGDNFDKAIMQNFIKEGKIPIHKLDKLASTALRHYCSKQKVKMQQTKMPFKVDLSRWGGLEYTFTPEVYKGLMKLTFSETINYMSDLIRKWIPSNEVYDVLLVGGSTHCPYLRDWIEEVTGVKPAPLTYDPDRVVAQGAALYADIVEKGELSAKVSDVTTALSIGLYDGTCSNIVPANSKIPLSVEKVFSNPVVASSLILELYQGGSMFKKDNECIGELVWEYDEPKDVQQGQVIVTISIDVNGIITFSACELLHEPKVVVLNRKTIENK